MTTTIALLSQFEDEDFATKYQNDVADAPQAEEQEAELTESESLDSSFEPIF